MEGRAAELSGAGGPVRAPRPVVRLATPDDVDLLAPIERSAGERFRDVGMASVADDPEPPREVYVEAVGRNHVWVAELETAAALGDGPVGYAWVLVLGPDGNALGHDASGRGAEGRHHLEQISVVPEAGGLGVGAALMEAVIGWARADGGSALSLSTFRDLPFNRPWYERFGFEVIPGAEVADDPCWQAVRRHEGQAGLDIEARVIMRKVW
jgi:GNAT superfamily N-acetyltransferase